MRIEHIYRYPVKGLTAEALEEVMLAEGQCLPHDRRFALAQGDAPFDPAAPAWLQKRHFGCLMANARLALLHSAFDPKTGQLAIRPPEGPPLLGDTRSESGRAEIAAFLTRHLGEEARGTPRFVEAPGHHFTDVAVKCVSIIGLASLAALEKAVGQKLDLLRFRANVYVSGGTPWAEFDWLGQEIQLGAARLRVFKRIVRCPATEVNPDTAERDAKPPQWLRQHFGHADLGVYAEVIEGGRIAVGDALEPLEGDLLH
ncbi:MOSC domain-containing protein [Siccirubricoccus sp. KC 17139]|uniref:MOSC domain-containing protein n=1 Tax=Siccirubricoccus soli TaxID=2899147 RepID=A0ABT1DB78_9PROT|nr:MOSC domain-containing protein [Siccirubricoccus soli]MCO6419195.1 MOSC domain-containing protein [Siccirubricoccus soli]MCP2685330.1 MOSC domain-containing protein [Siccirubricoccus soli]